jgi:hypothetical protein
LDGTCAGLEWIGAQNRVEYPFAGCLACAKDNWITSGVPGGNAEDDLARQLTPDCKSPGSGDDHSP